MEPARGIVQAGEPELEPEAPVPSASASLPDPVSSPPLIRPEEPLLPVLALVPRPVWPAWRLCRQLSKLLWNSC